jgi:hypothetical protein
MSAPPTAHADVGCMSQMRVDGKFVDAEGEPPTDGQYVRRVASLAFNLPLLIRYLIYRVSSTCFDVVTVSSTG